MPRLVRRAPLVERIQAYLNPLDFLLWLSEEIDSNDWDEFQRSYSTSIGLGLNLVFLIARANSGRSTSGSSGLDDVFGDDQQGGTGWLSWFASFILHLLTLFSLLNAIYTFQRRRHYRLFQASVDITPSTPSAHRVRVDSSPLSSSPLRFLTNIIASSTAESRAHPDPTRDVWELVVWDPFPLCLRLFCLFSPGHVLVYWLFLPTRPQDPRPSTTVLTTIFLGALLSIQLHFLQSNFSQQIKDTALIHKEVLNEYDTKFVHPQMYPLVRDVGTQYRSPDLMTDKDKPREKEDIVPNSVHAYTPTVVVNKGFKIHPNTNYARYYDPDSNHDLQNGDIHPRKKHHHHQNNYQTPTYQTQDISSSSTLRKPYTQQSTTMRQPQFRSSTTPITTTGTSASTGDGGSLGIYSHANSPLKKMPMPYTYGHAGGLGSSGVGMGKNRNVIKREGSPLKRSSVFTSTSTGTTTTSSGNNSSATGGGGMTAGTGGGLGLGMRDNNSGYF